jgi:hypothetical protein
MATRKIEEIKTHSLFQGLFTINGDLLAKIEQNMRDENYDDSQPIILATWEGQDQPVCIDGHTRLKAANNAGIEEISVYSYEFEAEEDAFEYAIRLQSNRRNLTDGDLIQCIERLHERMPRGGDRRSEHAKESTPQCCGTENGRSAQAKRTAALLNISARKVEQALTVIAHGSTETKQAVVENEMSINRAYDKTQKERKAEEAGVPQTNPEAKACKDNKELAEGNSGNEVPRVAPVLVPLELFGKLHQLGGSVEDHVSAAVKRYLESLTEPYGENHSDNDAEDEHDGDYSQTDEFDEDDEEYFDPADYEDE